MSSSDPTRRKPSNHPAPSSTSRVPPSEPPGPFSIRNNMLMGNRGPIIADEIDIPSPHTRHYQALEARIHTMSDREARNFGTRLRHDIHQFDQQDSLERARNEGRMVYRSWPASAHATQEIALSRPRQEYTSGHASLAVTRNPTNLRQAQTDHRRGLLPDPFTSSPATLLGNDPSQPERLWSGSGPGMVSTLQPEERYVALEALNRRVQHTRSSPELAELNEQLRAEVTRPHLFENADLSSMVMRLPGGTARYGRPAMGSDNPAADFKLRENATRYQSYMRAHGRDGPAIHNEMTVHYRASGHHSTAREMVERQISQTDTVTEPRFSIGGLSFGSRSRIVPAPPVTVIRDENPSRDRNDLQDSIRSTEHPVRNTRSLYPVLKR